MKLYREVPITSAEQAEALPEGTILHMPRGRWSSGLTGSVVRSPHHDETIFRVGVDRWPVRRVLDVFAGALVPIEAEEERSPDPYAIRPWPDASPSPLPERRRYVTPWEEA